MACKPYLVRCHQVQASPTGYCRDQEDKDIRVQIEVVDEWEPVFLRNASIQLPEVEP